MSRRTGEKPRVNQPLNIDRLPQSMRDRIVSEHDKRGRPWLEIEAESPRWEEWKEVPQQVAEEFPGCRLPHSNLHRWYDLRVAQVQREVMQRAAQAREIAAVFSTAAVDGADDAVLNAARDLIFAILQEGDTKSQATAAKGLIALAEVMQSARANDIKERKVAVDERRTAVLEKKLENMKGSVKGLKEAVDKKEVSPEQLQQKLDEIYGLGA